MSGEVEKCPILHVCPKFDVFTLPEPQLFFIWPNIASVNPLYTNGFFLLIGYNKLGIVHCTYQVVSGYKFS